MQVRFRFAEILDEFHDTGRGVIKRVSEGTGLERHQVSSLLKNEVQYLSLNSLGAICDYLINTHHVNPYDLPGRLFALEPEDFWVLLSERQSLVMSFGVRHELHETGVLWIPAADSYLQGTLLHELYGTESPRPGLSPPAAKAAFQRSIRSEVGPRFDQYMVRCWSPQPNMSHELNAGEFEQMKTEATASYDKFHAIAGNKALVCLGSVKSNGLCELAVSRAFSTFPWVSQDGISLPGQRSCPFFFHYREKDVNVPSCHGGKQLAQDLTGQQLSTREPGIYYEKTPGQWEGIPTNKQREPALIVYTYSPPRGIVEVVLGGFSTVGTFLLAQHFRKIVRELWPPTFISPSLEAGVFVVDFQLKAKSKPASKPEQRSEFGSSIRELEHMEVIRLPEPVLAPRLAKTGDQ